jgi:hypothetical protein
MGGWHSKEPMNNRSTAFGSTSPGDQTGSTTTLWGTMGQPESPGGERTADRIGGASPSRPTGADETQNLLNEITDADRAKRDEPEVARMETKLTKKIGQFFGVL